MKKYLLYGLLISSLAFANSKIQNEDVKSLTDITAATLTTTGNLTNSNVCISSPGSTTGLGTGQFIYDTTNPSYIPSGTTIVALPGSCSAGQIQMSQNATHAATADTLTFGGQMSQLINDSKMYVSGASLNSQLSTLLTTNSILNTSSTNPVTVPAVITFSNGIVSSSPIAVASGGTGRATLTSHDLLIGNGTANVTLVAPSSTVGFPLLSNGSSADPSYGALNLSSGVTGTLPIGSGGTNQTSFNAPSANVAGLVYFDGTRLANNATVGNIGYNTSTNTLVANASSFVTVGATTGNITTVNTTTTNAGNLRLAGNTLSAINLNGELRLLTNATGYVYAGLANNGSTYPIINTGVALGNNFTGNSEIDLFNTYTSASNSFSLYQQTSPSAATQLMHIDPTGNMGIQNSGGVQVLNLGNSAVGTNTYSRYQNNGATTGLDVGLRESDGAGLVWHNDAKSLVFGTNNTPALTLNSSQNAIFAGTLSNAVANGTNSFSFGSGTGSLSYAGFSGNSFLQETAVSQSLIFGTASTGSLILRTNGNPAITIDTSQNITFNAANLEVTTNKLEATATNGDLILTAKGTGYTYLNIAGTVNNGSTYPVSATGASAVGWNFSGGSQETDFFNTATSAARSFGWYQQTGAGSATNVMNLSAAGTLTLNLPLPAASGGTGTNLVSGGTGNVSNPAVSSNIFTPSLVGLSNISSFNSLSQFFWYRVGNTVHVLGGVNYTTSGLAPTYFIAVPIQPANAPFCYGSSVTVGSGNIGSISFYPTLTGGNFGCIVNVPSTGTGVSTILDFTYLIN